METELCPTCATPMVARKNKNKGYFAVCPNKENHGKEKAPVISLKADKIPGTIETPAGPEIPKKKSFLEGTIFG